MPKNTTDILLINLGTPSSPTQKAITNYLREFLKDPRVIDIKNPWRWIFVNSLIVPFRKQRTTFAYQQIWQKEGSPLLIHSKNLTTDLANILGEKYRVKLAMRYGEPSIEKAIAAFMNDPSERLLIIPLYPQYSSAANGTALEKIFDLIKCYHNIPAINVIKPFYDHPLFIDSYAAMIQETLSQHDWDFMLFAYHGLPERHIEKSGCDLKFCDRQNSCPPTVQNPFCYRQQCFITTRALAQKLNLYPSQYQICFQSRLGKLPWIKPYADEMLPLLSAQGIRNLAVVSPSFICDCLETLEESGIRLRKVWQELGGREFILIPSLNNHPKWVDALSMMIKTLNE